MKNLLDIQKDVRILGKSIQDIKKSVETINSDIEALRNSTGSVSIDFAMIEALAKQIRFKEHPLEDLEDGRACQVYLEMLLNIIRLDPDYNNIINRMTFIQWLQIQSHIDWSLKDLYKDCFQTDREFLYEMIQLFSKRYLKSFVVDALIVANITGKPNEEIYKYITDIVAVLGVTIEELNKLAVISKAALNQGLLNMTRKDIEIVLDNASEYSHYINDPIIKKGIMDLRVIAVQFHDADIRSFKWKAKQLQKVKKDDVIALYQEKIDINKDYSFILGKHSAADDKKLIAPVDGTLFQFRDNNTFYGVIAYKGDNKEAIKTWVKTRR